MKDSAVTLVVLPGLDGTDVFLRPFLALLPGAIRTVPVCYPATGDNGYERLLALVRDAIAELPPFYVFASSFSGPLAVMLAAAEPQKIRGLILCATFLRPPKERLHRFGFATVTPVVWFWRAVRRIPVWTRRSRADPLRRAKAETWRRVSARCLAARLRAVLGVDVREAFRACPKPVLNLSFAQDKVVAQHHGEDILRARPAARMVTLPGHHLSIFTDPGGVAAEVVRFITEAESAPGGT